MNKFHESHFSLVHIKITPKFALSSIVIALFLVSCQTPKIPAGDDFSDYGYIENFYPEEITWSPLKDDGFWLTDYDIKSIGVSWHCVKIDLNNENLEIVWEPKAENLGKRFWLTNFARKNKTVVAINTTPFDLDGKTYLPVGITKNKNEIISECKERYCALALIRNEKNQLRAQIIDHQTPEQFENSEFAVGGFFTILDDDTIYEFTKIRRSRVGCGISDEGRYLYIFVTTPHFEIRDRNGLNYEECAVILRQLGCTKAMQFDGGHSSGFCIYNKQVEVPFLQRKVPTALGIRITQH